MLIEHYILYFFPQRDCMRRRKTNREYLTYYCKSHQDRWPCKAIASNVYFIAFSARHIINEMPMLSEYTAVY